MLEISFLPAENLASEGILGIFGVGLSGPRDFKIKFDQSYDSIITLIWLSGRSRWEGKLLRTATIIFKHLIFEWNLALNKASSKLFNLNLKNEPARLSLKVTGYKNL